MDNNLNELSVYLVLKSVFCGVDAHLRKSKKIKELILKQQESTDVKDLIETHNIDSVCKIAKDLLEQQVFESTLKAKVRFPEAFEVSPTQNTERSASEREAAHTEVEAIRIVAEDSLGPISANRDVHQVTDVLEVNTPVPSIVSLGKRKKQHLNSQIPSLYPLYLPFPAQHKLLVTVQQALEKACYNFAVTSLPEVIAKHLDWDCAEAIELNVWARILAMHPDRFVAADVNEVGVPLDQLFDSITQLRHTGVHRLRVSATKLDTFLTDAESLATLIRDEHCKQQISRLRHKTCTIVEDIKRNKDLLESELRVKFRNIAAQREELDRLESTSVVDMLREDHEYKERAGMLINQAIDTPETAVQSTIGREGDPESDIDAIGLQSNGLCA